MPKYFFRFLLKSKKKLDPTKLFDAISQADDQVTKKLNEITDQRYLKFNFDAQARIEDTDIIIDINMELILSPLTRLFPKQDEIAEALAYEFISDISRKLGGLIEYFEKI